MAETDWFCENVRSVYEYGLMVGKGEGIFDPQGRRQGVVHAAVRRIQVGMHTDGGDAAGQQLHGFDPLGVSGAQVLQFKEEGVVADDELCPPLRRLPDHGTGDVQRQEHRVRRPIRRTHQEPHVVKVQPGLHRGL